MEKIGCRAMFISCRRITMSPTENRPCAVRTNTIRYIAPKATFRASRRPASMPCQNRDCCRVIPTVRRNRSRNPVSSWSCRL